MALSCMQLCIAVCVVGCLLATTATAVSCSCFYGKAASPDSCECTCQEGYLQPTCSFTSTDTVELSFALNTSSSNFIAELFTNAVAYAAKANATFVYGTNVSAFNKVRATVSVPGFAVSRVLDGVQYRDPWVVQYHVVSASVVTPATGDPRSSSISLGFAVYESGNVVILVEGIMWIIFAFVIVLLLTCVEYNTSHNVEELVQPTALKHRRSSSRYFSASDVDGKPSRNTSNLNEHRRKAPPASMSLPEQILEDFVDSGSDDDVSTAQHGSVSPRSRGTSHAKYSLGKQSSRPAEGRRQQPAASSPTRRH